MFILVWCYSALSFVLKPLNTVLIELRDFLHGFAFRTHSVFCPIAEGDNGDYRFFLWDGKEGTNLICVAQPQDNSVQTCVRGL